METQDGWLVRGKQTLRSICPQPILNWRETQFYARFGEVELHLLQFLCRPGEALTQPCWQVPLSSGLAGGFSGCVPGRH